MDANSSDGSESLNMGGKKTSFSPGKGSVSKTEAPGYKLLEKLMPNFSSVGNAYQSRFGIGEINSES